MKRRVNTNFMIELEETQNEQSQPSDEKCGRGFGC